MPLEPFAHELVQQLERRGDTFPVTPATCDQALGRVGAWAGPLQAEDEAKLSRWLGAREQEHRFLVYRAGETGSEWGTRCLRQADDVVVLASAGTSPAACEYDPAGDDLVRRRTSLVLLHKRGVYRQTAAKSKQAPTAQITQHPSGADSIEVSVGGFCQLITFE